MKTRIEVRTRKVPHTIDGKTSMVDDEYTVHVPVPPRDWDQVVRTGVTAAAGLIVTASVVWSTASIGDLLDRVVIAPAAYAAAGVFDLVWISCMAIEWLARYDTRRAQLPRRAGHAALALAMAAVAIHGWLAGHLAIGLVGAAVSGLAKGLWTVVLTQAATPLDHRTQQWVDQQRAEAGGRLAMVAVRRQLQRAEGQVQAEAAALTTGADTDPEPQADTDPDADADPDTVVRPLRPSVREAVRTALGSGFDDTERVLAYVRKVADPDARPDTVDRYIRALRPKRSA
ncbi:protein transporter Sec31 [Streptomyces sp. ISL-98]|uniref:protein transporter Sec31 n=1 Tax=Streptomyces sp. ISL-98 TaxID=2819192 RepID=UPI001BE900C0|nr:protein transporter Sec31 [Streptomyces sp. ISL-98]MBT2505140.1 protein transporter Sec31 [Streptomyces sp. ISL-98]